MAHAVMVPLPGGGVYVPPNYMSAFAVVHQLVGATAMTAGQVGASDQQQISGDADFVIDRQSAIYDPVAGGQLEGQFEIVPGETLHQLALPLSTLGSARFPQYFSRVIPRGALFRFLCDDRRTVQVAVPGAVRVLSAGHKLFASPEPDQPPRLYSGCDEFRYTSKWTPTATGGPGVLGSIPANGSVPNAISIQAAHDFMLERIAIIVDSTDATLDIQTSTRNRGMFSRTCHVGLLAATTFDADPPAGAWPWTLPVPQFIPAMGTITLAAADLSGATNRMIVMLLGWRLFPAGGLPVSAASRARIGIERELERLGSQHEAVSGGYAEAGADLRDEFLGRERVPPGMVTRQITPSRMMPTPVAVTRAVVPPRGRSARRRPDGRGWEYT